MVEFREHAFLADLMESLEMGFGADANIEMEDVDTLEEELEHTNLDKILQEWEVEEDDEMEEGVMKDCTKGLDVDAQILEVESEVGIDECIRTITCKDNCSGSLEMSCQVPELWVGRGKIEKDMQNRIVSTSPTVHVDSVDCRICLK